RQVPDPRRSIGHDQDQFGLQKTAPHRFGPELLFQFFQSTSRHDGNGSVLDIDWQHLGVRARPSPGLHSVINRIKGRGSFWYGGLGPTPAPSPGEPPNTPLIRD